MSVYVVVAAMILEYLRSMHIYVVLAAKIHECVLLLQLRSTSVCVLLQLRSTSVCVVVAAKIHKYLCGCCS